MAKIFEIPGYGMWSKETLQNQLRIVCFDYQYAYALPGMLEDFEEAKRQSVYCSFNKVKKLTVYQLDTIFKERAQGKEKIEQIENALDYIQELIDSEKIKVE